MLPDRRQSLFVATLYLLLAGGATLWQRAAIDAAVNRQVAAASRGAAVEERLTRTPPMGYDDWNAVSCNVSEGLIARTARAMATDGLAAAGYRYVNIDDCWSAPSRDAGGNLQSDPQRFPHGIRALARYVHALGLKLGIYADAGTATCAGYPGSYGHEMEDAGTFASWGVDYLKEDWCNIPYRRFPGYSESEAGRLLAARMAGALHATGRPIVLSLSNASDPTLAMWRWGNGLAQLRRTTADITDTWSTVLAILDANEGEATTAGPGHWNDPDMLEVGNGAMTEAEDRAHFSLWSIMAAPLIIGTDVTAISPATRTILTKRAVIAVDQDRLGALGTAVSRSGHREVLMKPLANGDRAVVLLNRGAPQTTIAVGTAELGLSPTRRYAVRDLWTGRQWAIRGEITAPVAPDSAVMLRIH